MKKGGGIEGSAYNEGGDEGIQRKVAGEHDGELITGTM